MRELPGNSPKNFRGSLGNFRGSSPDFPEARASLTPSKRLTKFVSKNQVEIGSKSGPNQVRAEGVGARGVGPAGGGDPCS